VIVKQPGPKPASEIILYQTEDNRTRLQVRLEGETVWLTQAQMAELFQTTIPNVSMHIRNIFAEGELQAGSVIKEFLTTAADGKNYSTKFHNLDVIISVGYRVKSHRGTQFRIWATQRLREYLVKGSFGGLLMGRSCVNRLLPTKAIKENWCWCFQKSFSGLLAPRHHLETLLAQSKGQAEKNSQTCKNALSISIDFHWFIQSKNHENGCG